MTNWIGKANLIWTAEAIYLLTLYYGLRIVVAI